MVTAVATNWWILFREAKAIMVWSWSVLRVPACGAIWATISVGPLLIPDVQGLLPSDSLLSISSWQNLEDPSQSLKCSCCDSHCPADSAPPEELREFIGEGMLHREVAGPLTVHKEEAPWYEERCRTLKKLLLVGVAFAGSCLVGALFVGGLLALALALFRSYQRSKGQRLLRKREYPYQTELQSVVNALVTTQEIQKDERESSIDYKLNTDASEKE
ncbi:uncharacterized protein ACDP82_016731 [Pangshura tecta]